ncbi:DUF418 domain-containing protein [Stackebrandtia soli]|uniref:DUF418 domain-containing protein n=1 Tax=Stackebrandtia soli TaxID=1892856 RepID=UPI0039EC8417
MTTPLQTRPPGAVPGPVRRADRALAPDLARGAMLLIIALAHAPSVFFDNAPGVDTTPHGLERLYNIFLFTFVHARGLPLFALMFGYGLIQLARRQDTIGEDPRVTRSILLRRNAWLFVFGALHGILLFSGDILGAYGILGIIFTLVLLRRGDKVHRVAVAYVVFGAVYLAVLAVLVTVGIMGSGDGDATVSTVPFMTATGADYLDSILIRLGEWPLGTLTFLSFILVVWFGAWAARHRVLEEPAKHRRALRLGAILGFVVGIAGGLPMGLQAAGFLHVDEGTGDLIKLLYQTSGFFGGIGYVCVFGLVALRLSRRSHRSTPSTIVTALTALGQRSLSGYILQSIAWLVLASPYTLALGTTVDHPTYVSAACAVAIWLSSVVIAYLMHRNGYRGPAETLLRRLTYGRRRST